MYRKRARRYGRLYKRAKRGYKRGYQAIKLMTPELRRQLFGPTYMQRLADPMLPEMTPNQRWMRKAMNYRGEGDYWSDLLSGGWFKPHSGIASGIRDWGGKLGGLLGSSDTGKMIAGNLSKWAGFGDYGPQVANQIAGGGGGPITVNASDDLTGDVWISHKEFVGNVQCSGTGTAPSTFQQTVYQLNPGLSASFPFLSQLASNFELYDFHGLMYEYRPTSGENATANSLGKVMMATQYDPDAAQFLNSVQLQNYDYSASCKPSVGMVHGIETANKQQVVNMMFIRTGASTKAKTFTDLGYFTIATEGIPFNNAAGVTTQQILGELWVTYRIKLSRANLYNSLLGLSQPFDYFSNITSAAALWPVTTQSTRTGNSGIWTITPSLSAPTTTIIFTAPTSLIAGCFQFVVYYQENTPATTITNYNIGTNTNVTFIQQRYLSTAGSTDTTVKAFKAATENTGMVSGIVSVSNSDGKAPTFALAIVGTFAGVAGNLITVSIGQVPCSVMTSSLL